MAYRRSTRSRSGYGSRQSRSYSARGAGYSRTSRRRSTAGRKRASTGRSSSPGTLRIVIEQPQPSAISRRYAEMVQTGTRTKNPKAKF